MGIVFALFIIIVIFLFLSKQSKQNELAELERKQENDRKEAEKSKANEDKLAREKYEEEYVSACKENAKKHGIAIDRYGSYIMCSSTVQFYCIFTDGQNIELQKLIKRVKDRRKPYNEGVYYYAVDDVENDCVNFFVASDFGDDALMCSIYGDERTDYNLRVRHSERSPKVADIEIDGGGRDNDGFIMPYELYVKVEFGEHSTPYYWD